MLPFNECQTYTQTPLSHLYEVYQRPILAHLLRLTGDREAAEDLCQETFIKALRNWEAHDADSNVRAWLYRIATNTAYDYLRRRKRIQFTQLNDNDSDTYLTDSPEQQMGEQEPVLNALAQLPQMYRLPLVLHSCEGHSTQEIAKVLGCSNSAVKTRLFRARERFREVYQH